ncbi:MAG: DNA translocase FtsK 4TM domain-containing protein [Anaerolineae bacterium]|nr:DNA translocase FtsK 4TM domain-containing protein [Anaerolineae bacterium]
MTKKKETNDSLFSERGLMIIAFFKTLAGSPLVQQTLALILGLVALLTFTTLIDVTSGAWLDAWVRALQRAFGWGAFPVTAAIGAAAALIMLHHLDRPIDWRWRPVVGIELIFFSMLALTHLIAGRNDPNLLDSKWGGGAVGWAIAYTLGMAVGPLATGVICAVALLLGVYLVFDVTLDDVGRWLGALRRRPEARPAAHTRPAQTAPRRPAPTAPQRAASPPSHAKPQSQAKQSPPPQPTPPPAAKPTPAQLPLLPQQPQPQPVPQPAPIAVENPADVQTPSLDLLAKTKPAGLSDKEIREKSRIIVETLAQFALPVQVVEVRRGPTVTQFGVAPGYTDHGSRAKKVRVSQIASLSDDLALALAAPSLRIEAPVPGRSVVGIEVPNEEISLVSLRSVMESEEFERAKAPLALALGQDIAGEPVVADLSLMPHLLIAGTTGSGKSVCIKAIATCLAMTNRPDELQMVMIDPKMVEMVRFKGLPHLLGAPEYELERVTRVLRWVAHEMDQRYKQFATIGARNIDDYNQRTEAHKNDAPLPRIVVFIDELADLMMLAPDQTERTICRIAQMARATGIHLIVATQRPSVDVVTGLIKANFPARISFATASQTDSRVILDMPGAESLLGKGDMLYLASDAGHPVRVQGCLVNESEIDRVIGFWKKQMPRWTTEAPWEPMMGGAMAAEIDNEDPEESGLLEQAIELVQKRKTISASYLQRQLRIGYPRAARLMEQLEEMGMVGPQRAAGRPRRVIGEDQ